MMVSDNYNRGTIALEKGNYEKALQFLKRETYECKEVFLNIGTAYNELGNVEKAKEYFLKANDKFVPFMGETVVGKEYPNALGNLGLIAYMQWDDELSKNYCNRALSLDPLHMMSIWNYSLSMLREYCSGLPLHKWAWQMYEYRFKTIATKVPVNVIPRWDGKSRVKKLVIITEQGYGDKLMFGRYIEKCEEFCDELVVHCAKELEKLHDRWTTCNELPLDADASIPLCSLAAIFGIIDGEWLASKYPRNLNRDKMRVAVEWAGSKGHKNDRNRSCHVGYFNKLVKAFPDIEFVNIRPDSPKVKGINKILVKDWGDSATEIAKCDLVISVDTSLVHLAGSLGVPCLLMQPLLNTDFRWGNYKTKLKTGMGIESNIWYKSVKVLENKGWDKMLDEVILRLDIIRKEHEIRRWLNGYTVEEFVEEYKKQLNDKH